MGFDRKHIPFYLAALYFLLRLPFITRLPIFNDESIYLDWANRIIQGAVSPFYSLYDGTQPLLLWVFGAFSKVFPDPLFAGRLVGVLAGFAAMIGLYKLGKRVAGWEVASLAALFYIATPLFVFFDRQALMESSIAAIGVWSFYLLVGFLQSWRLKDMALLGILLGFGFFIKSSAAVFLAPVVTILFASFYYFPRRRRELAVGAFSLIVLFLVTVTPLFFQEQARTIFSGSNRYIMSFSELLRFPVRVWSSNLVNALEILFWHLFPSTFIFAGFAAFLSFKKKDIRGLPWLWFLLSLLLVVLLARSVHPRYLVAYTAPIIIFAAQGALYLIKKFSKVLLFLAVGLPLAVSLVLIFSPRSYLELLAKFTKTSDLQTYVWADTSGYGIDQVRAFLEEEARVSPVFVGVRLDSGNPESAMFAYYGANKNRRIQAIYFDKRVIDVPETLEFIESTVPLIFISRSENLAGMEKYLTEVKRFYKPDKVHFIGVYTLKEKRK